MAVHRHSYTSLQLNQQGGPAKEDEASKGKASAPNEFGVSPSSLPTRARFVQRIAHDGQPLRDVIELPQKLTGGQIEQGYVDKEYEPVLGYFNARVTSIAAIEKDGGNRPAIHPPCQGYLGGFALRWRSQEIRAANG